MAERRLRRILAVGCILWCVHLLREGTGPAGAAPAPDTPAFDSLVVTPFVFSPNGDGQLDVVRISYRLRDTTDVDITVTTLGGALTIKTLLSQQQTSRTPPPVEWKGDAEAAPGVAVPDGVYEIHLFGRTTAGQILENQRQVRVDTRSPVAVIDSLDPQVYTPKVKGTPSPPRVGVRVTNSDPGDSLNVQLRVSGTPGRTFKLRLQQSTQVLQGDGLYWAVCDSCVRDRAVPDGSHTVTAVTRDAAGNTTTAATVQLDKDALGPTLQVSHPLAGTSAHVQQADSLVGRAFDRHGVEAVWMRIAGSADSLVLPIVPPGDTSCVFRADLATPLAAEGRYKVELHSVDPFGARDSLRYWISVDRTAPKAPRLTPRPGPVSKLEALDVTLQVDTLDGVFDVTRSGGAAPDVTARVQKHGLVQFQVLLDPGANALSFVARDTSANVSPPETLTVVWSTSRGISCPERFRAGNRIQVHMGDVPGAGVELRILATDGSMVQRFEDHTSKLVYDFGWDLRTPEGVQVKNGAYLLFARLLDAGGGEQRIRKLIAVLE